MFNVKYTVTICICSEDVTWICNEISTKIMYKLLVINFLIKLYALKNIFNIICGKYGQTILNISRNMERTRIKIAKLKTDITFLLTCKRNNLNPAFARPKISINIDRNTRRKITKTIIEAELINKHKRLKYLKKEARRYQMDLQSSLGYVIFCALNRLINKRITGKRIEWKRIHERKLTQLFSDITPERYNQRPRNIVHNFSSYNLSTEEHHILSYGLDHHIPSRMNNNEIKTEFEAFFYQLKKQLRHLSSDEIDELKSKLRRSCENYYNLKTENKLDNIIMKLSRNKDIRILEE